MEKMASNAQCSDSKLKDFPIPEELCLSKSFFKLKNEFYWGNIGIQHSMWLSNIGSHLFTDVCHHHLTPTKKPILLQCTPSSLCLPPSFSPCSFNCTVRFLGSFWVAMVCLLHCFVYILHLREIIWYLSFSSLFHLAQSWNQLSNFTFTLAIWF